MDHLLTVGHQVGHHQGVVAVPALLHEAGAAVEVGVQVHRQQKFEAGVRRHCLDVAGVLPPLPQLAATVHLTVGVYLQLAVVVLVLEVEVAVGVFLRLVVVAAAYHRQSATVSVAHLRSAEVQVHLLLILETKSNLQMTPKLQLGIVFMHSYSILSFHC